MPSFTHSGWLADELVMWEECRPNVMLEDATTLQLNLYIYIVCVVFYIIYMYITYMLVVMYEQTRVRCNRCK